MRYERVGLATVAAYARSVLDHIRTVRHAFPLTLSARLPFLDIRVKLEEGTLAESIRRNFVQEAGDAPRPNAEPMEILVAHGGMEGVPPPASWAADEPYRPHEIASLLDAEGMRASYFHDLDYWQILDVAGGFGVQLMRDRDGYPPWEPCAPMRPFLHWHYARTGMRLAHCGTLGLNGAGVLLAGAGGAGKSGTVVAGLLNGLQSIGDDYVLLAATEDVVGYPVFAALKQDQAGFERLGLGSRLPAAGPLNWQHKYEFHLADVSSAPTPARLSMKALLVPRLGAEAKTRIEPVSRRDAMLAFAPSSIQQMPGERESGFAFFSRVARRLPCYTLSLGREPAEIAGKIAEFLERNS